MTFRMMKQSNILKCPFVIMMPDHYREDGSCLCNDADHRKNVMMKEWEYKESDFKKKGIYNAKPL